MDGELLARIANGDRQAFRGLYTQTSARLFAVCLRILRNREEAEEVLQEAYVKIWERSYQYDPARGAMLPWLATIVRNCAIDRLRQPGRDMVPLDDDTAADIDSTVAALDSVTDADLKRCLANLRADYRRALVLAYVSGLTHDELAAALKRPVGTIKSWIRRGGEALKDCMER